MKVTIESAGDGVRVSIQDGPNGKPVAFVLSRSEVEVLAGMLTMGTRAAVFSFVYDVKKS